jgi:hypothetical protein
VHGGRSRSPYPTPYETRTHGRANILGRGPCLGVDIHWPDHDVGTERLLDAPLSNIRPYVANGNDE